MKRIQQLELSPENKDLAHYPKGGLCHRCENRAHALETGSIAKPQCLELSVSLKSCNAWRPVRPVVVLPKDDKPIFGDVVDSTELVFVRVVTDRDMKTMPINVKGDGISAIWRK